MERSFGLRHPALAPDCTPSRLLLRRSQIEERTARVMPSGRTCSFAHVPVSAPAQLPNTVSLTRLQNGRTQPLRSRASLWQVGPDTRRDPASPSRRRACRTASSFLL